MESKRQKSIRYFIVPVEKFVSDTGAHKRLMLGLDLDSQSVPAVLWKSLCTAVNLQKCFTAHGSWLMTRGADDVLMFSGHSIKVLPLKQKGGGEKTRHPLIPAHKSDPMPSAVLRDQRLILRPWIIHRQTCGVSVVVHVCKQMESRWEKTGIHRRKMQSFAAFMVKNGCVHWCTENMGLCVWCAACAGSTFLQSELQWFVN